MKKMKKLIRLITVLVMTAAVMPMSKPIEGEAAYGLFAQYGIESGAFTYARVSDVIMYAVNYPFILNASYSFSNTMQTDLSIAPQVINDTTFVPIRASVLSMQGVVLWNEDTQSATLRKGDNIIVLTIGSNTAYLNGEEYTLDVAPVIIDDHTMLPIRFVAEGFGYTVDWYDENDMEAIFLYKNTALENSDYEFLRENAAELVAAAMQQTEPQEPRQIEQQ